MFFLRICVLASTLITLANCSITQSYYVDSYQDAINELSELKIAKELERSIYSSKLQVLNGEFAKLNTKMTDDNGKILSEVMYKYIIFLYFFSVDNIDNALKAGSELIIAKVSIDETIFIKQFWYEFHFAAFLDKRVLNNKFFTDFEYKMKYDQDLIKSIEKDLEVLSTSTGGVYDKAIYGEFKDEIYQVILYEVSKLE